MKTIVITLYKFSELSEEAKQTALSEYRNKGYDYSFYYEELKESIKELCEVFNIKTGRNSWSDLNFGNIDDNILELSGVRLYKYLINNYYSDLFKPVYIELINKPVYYKQFICKVSKNKEYTQIYSRLKKDNSCVLTGVCYNHDILKPVYSFLLKPDNGTTFEDLFRSIEHAISKTFEGIDEWVNSDEFIKEEVTSNDMDFTENGKIY